MSDPIKPPTWGKTYTADAPCGKTFDNEFMTGITGALRAHIPTCTACMTAAIGRVVEGTTITMKQNGWEPKP